MSTQMKLDSFGLKGNAPVNHGPRASNNCKPAFVQVCIESIEPDFDAIAQIPPGDCSPSVQVSIESVGPDLCAIEDHLPAPLESPNCVFSPDETPGIEGNEDWEDELINNAACSDHVCDWAELRDEIKSKLAHAKRKRLPLGQINQLLIIQNFATLQLKGLLKMRASKEIALQWHENSVLWKGVYVDGHERTDLERKPPLLLQGGKEIIAQFHNELGFHVNDFKVSSWLGPGQLILQKKGQGCLIHVSDFINEANGCLICQDEVGNIRQDARQIIYPSSNGNAWWDTQQQDAINIFKEAHPTCQALFIFDQSPAHASLGPDALKAFEMNKGNGGKQRIW
ncbi:hypothetical protein DFJ43DRAFT_1042097 [Lentinula guzmanii]|uniref:DDE-1 domain-containing protein n=1 Tax=Lentinula guzmanii TaxID=2804957 RepID=A0AA38JH35_9AGAR|nr:hypothetical protein DFJ43DRAFT_1042097 [Lentinula guzmanii]